MENSEVHTFPQFAKTWNTNGHVKRFKGFFEKRVLKLDPHLSKNNESSLKMIILSFHFERYLRFYFPIYFDVFQFF